MDDLKVFLSLLKDKKNIPETLHQKIIKAKQIPDNVKTLVERAMCFVGGGKYCNVQIGKLIGSGSFGSVYTVTDDIYVKIFNEMVNKKTQILGNLENVYIQLSKENVVETTTFTKNQDCLLAITDENLEGYFLKKCDGTLTNYFKYFMNLINTFNNTYTGLEMEEAFNFVLEHIESAMTKCYHEIYYINSLNVIMGDVKDGNILFTQHVDPETNLTNFKFYLHDFDGACIYPNKPVINMCTPMTSHPLFMKYCAGAFNDWPFEKKHYLLGLLNQQQLIKQLTSGDMSFYESYKKIMSIVDEICANYKNTNLSGIEQLEGGQMYLKYLHNLKKNDFEIHIKFMDLYSLSMTAFWISEIYMEEGNQSSMKICTELKEIGKDILKRYLNMKSLLIGGNSNNVLIKKRTDLTRYFLRKNILLNKTSLLNKSEQSSAKIQMWTNLCNISGIYSFENNKNKFSFGDNTLVWTE